MAHTQSYIDNTTHKYCIEIDSYIDIYLKYMYYIAQNVSNTAYQNLERCKMKILLIDDTIRHRRAGKQQLTALGHEVRSFGTYSEARHAVDSGETFDVALIDLNMPAEVDPWGAGFPKDYLGQSVAVGYPLALSLSLLGIPRVALSSDGGHHANPSNAMLDWLKGRLLEVNGRKIIYLEAPMTQDAVGEAVKDWSTVLEKILSL